MTDATTHDPATAPAWEIRVGDVLARLAEMPDDSVHCVVTSPPYFGLRDYGTASWDGGDPDCGHSGPPKRTNAGFNERYFGKAYATDKQGDTVNEPYRSVCGRCGARRVDQQLGLEATPDGYLAKMVAVFREVRRVLRPDGTCFVNMGDGYAGGNQTGRNDNGRPEKDRGWAEYDIQRTHVEKNTGLKPKDLIGMPWRLAFALQADGWLLRSEIIWAKPNPMPESVTDRPTKAHEQIFLLTKRATYYYDSDAVREKIATVDWRPATGSNHNDSTVTLRNDGGRHGGGQLGDPAGRNARSVWTIATAPFAEAHFATFPPEIPRRCIAAGTSERGVCPACGSPWRRVVEMHRNGRDWNANNRSGGNRLAVGQSASDAMPTTYRPPTHIGWEPTCTHDATPIPATVLDPFSGAGTTVMVALRMGRSGIGIELNPEYAEMSRARILSDRGAVEPTNSASPHGMAAVQGRMMGL